jgi:hypothetical protein
MPMERNSIKGQGDTAGFAICIKDSHRLWLSSRALVLNNSGSKTFGYPRQAPF